MDMFSLLAFIAVVAIYVKWNYGSPFLRGSLAGDSFFRRSIPLLLFVASGILGTVALNVSSDLIFYILFSTSACCLISAPVVTYYYRRKLSKRDNS